MGIYTNEQNVIYTEDSWIDVFHVVFLFLAYFYFSHVLWFWNTTKIKDVNSNFLCKKSCKIFNINEQTIQEDIK